jgi:hypothetical protein
MHCISLNEFLVPNLDRVRSFIDNLATLEESSSPSPIPSYHVEKELASLSRHLKKGIQRFISSNPLEYSAMEGKITTDADKKDMAALHTILQIIDQLEQVERQNQQANS